MKRESEKNGEDEKSKKEREQEEWEKEKMRKNKINKRWIKGEGVVYVLKREREFWRFVEREKKIRR